MHAHIKPARIALLALVMAACASNEWTRKDTSAEQAKADLEECEDAAFTEVNTPSPGYPTMGPAVLVPPGSKRRRTDPVGPFSDPNGERYQREGRVAAECMRKKGYEQPTRGTGN